MIAYKVVRNLDGKLVSVWASNSWMLEYAPNTVTTPNVGKLFAFRSYADAQKYCKQMTLDPKFAEIWKCKVRGVSKRKTMCSASVTYDWHAFWLDQIPVYERLPVIKGTILVDEVTLLEKLN